MRVLNFLRQNSRGLLAVFLVYFYFLEFSQFTLLHLLDGRLDDAIAIKGILGGMAACGIMGSVLAVYLRRKGVTRMIFAPGFMICGLVALAAPHAANLIAFILLAGLMGMLMGLLTVSTAGLLPLLLPGARRGLSVGIATGLAYAVCNVPVLFEADPETRSRICGLVLVLGGAAFLGWLYTPPLNPSARSRYRQFLHGRWRWVVLAFLALIWLDSALFFIIQENRALQTHSWAGSFQLWMNAAFHLAGAVLGGWLLDRGRNLVLLPVAWFLLTLGALGLQQTGSGFFIYGYVAGVSIYSCVLVYLPSLGCREPGEERSFFRAMLVYVIAGWIGSGLGIGMAENLSRVPAAFLVVSALALLPVLKMSMKTR